MCVHLATTGHVCPSSHYWTCGQTEHGNMLLFLTIYISYCWYHWPVEKQPPPKLVHGPGFVDCYHDVTLTYLLWLERCDRPNCWTALSALHGSSNVRWTRRRWLPTRRSAWREIPDSTRSRSQAYSYRRSSHKIIQSSTTIVANPRG